MSENFRIALAYVLNRKRQSVISVLGVMMGVAFFIAISSMMVGFQNYFIEQTINVSPHVTVKDEFRLPPRQPAEMKFPDATIALKGKKPKDELRGIKNFEFIAHYLERNETGLHYAPTLTGQIFLRYGGKDVGATMMGIDPALERHVSNLTKDMTIGNLDSLMTDSNGIILGEGLASKLGARLNTKLSVISPAGVIMIMRVVGIFRTGIVTIDDVQCYALLRKAQVLQDKPNIINQIRMRLADIERADSLAKMIEARFGYRTESWKEANQNIFNIFVIQNIIMYSTVGAILLVSGFGIYNIISTVVYEKNRDIAILKSMGFYERDIKIIFVYQGLIIGLVGMLCGWALGFVLYTILDSIRLDIGGIVKTDRLMLYTSVSQYLIGGAMAVVSAAFSAFLPSSKAAKLNPVEIIRGAT